MKTFAYLAVIFLFTNPVLAVEEEKNNAVTARMEAMKEIAANMKALRKISKGMLVTDTAKVQKIISNIAVLAAQTPDLFKESVADVNTKAKPEIWKHFSDFSAKAKILEQTSNDLSKSTFSSQDLKKAITKIGKACKACHKNYKRSNN